MPTLADLERQTIELQKAITLERQRQLGPTAILPYSKQVAAVTQDEIERQVPFDGFIESIFMSFPAGTNQLVEVQVFYVVGGKENVMPTRDESPIALDDAFPVFVDLNFPVARNGKILVVWSNYDSANAHTVPVLVVVKPKGALI